MASIDRLKADTVALHSALQTAPGPAVPPQDDGSAACESEHEFSAVLESITQEQTQLAADIASCDEILRTVKAIRDVLRQRLPRCETKRRNAVLARCRAVEREYDALVEAKAGERAALERELAQRLEAVNREIARCTDEKRKKLDELLDMAGIEAQEGLSFAAHNAVVHGAINQLLEWAGTRSSSVLYDSRVDEFTERAFLNGRLDLGAAEAVLDLIDARTERAADDAAARLGGAASRALEALYAATLDVSSRLEHALDFSEEELPPDFADTLRAALGGLRAAVERKLSTAREGRILREGARVVLAGAPNAGKSSLLNALLGTRRAIVSEAAGTTRDAIEEWVEIGGWPVRLIDTAGLRAASDAVEAVGVARATALIDAADLVLRLVPCADAVDGQSVAGGGTELRVWSKCDQVPDGSAPRGGVRVSAVTGEGLSELRTAIAARLAERAAKSAEETGVDVTTRQKECLLAAQAALARADDALAGTDWVVAANELRGAAEALGRMLGKVYSDDLLDALFSRFCVGK